jgi:hypothetical protein
MSVLRKRAWLLLELGAIVIAVAVWWVFFWAPGQSRKHDALRAFDQYTAKMPATWRRDRDVVQNEDTSYLVCSRRDAAGKGVRHLCLSVRTDLPKGQQVTGGYRVATIGYDLPTGTKSDCFGLDTGECS